MEKSKKRSAALRTLQIYWQELKQYKLMLAALLILTLVATITYNYVWPLFVSQMINELVADADVGFAQLWPLALAAIAAVAISDIVLFRLELVMHWKLDLKVWRRLSERVFATLSKQSMHFHNDRFSGSIVSQTNKFTGAFEKLADTWTWNLFPMIISIATVTIVLSAVGLQWLALILLFMSVAFIVYNIVAFRRSSKLNEDLADAENKLSGQLADAVTNIAAVKSFSREKHEAMRFKQRNNRVYDSSTDLLWGVTRVQFIFAILVSIMTAATIVILAGGREWFNVEIGTLVLAVTYTISLGNSIWNFNNVMRGINRAFGDAYEMTKILDEKVSVHDAPNATDLQVNRGCVDIHEINFKHADGDQVFREFSLTIPAGQRVGLVGRSGSGKTTLTKLLLRFSDVQKGEILIDGQNIADVTQDSLRKSIAYVPQEPMLFHRTVAENISYGRPDASPEEIREAAKQANALEFIDQLPKGFDTLTGERGVKLSGGQKQRVAITRAILKNAPILVLDEATSALDTESEKLIQEALQRLMSGRTSIVIAHRLSTVAELDRIIVLSDGKIVEDGSHSELLARNGTYAKLWNRQTGLCGVIDTDEETEQPNVSGAVEETYS